MVFFWCKFGFGKCLDDKESACNAGDLHLIPGSEDPLKKGMAIHPVFLPGEFHGQRSLVDWSPWSYKELDMTEHLTHFRASQSSHWAGHHQLSYKIHFLLHVTIQLRNDSLLLHRIREDNTSKWWFFWLPQFIKQSTYWVFSPFQFASNAKWP